MSHTQHPYRCRFDWGRRGVREAAARNDILVIVDILNFSTSVATAIAHHGIIYPTTLNEDSHTLAERVGAAVAVRRGEESAAQSSFTLSPLSYPHIRPGTRVVLPSPNGATCSRYAAEVPYLFVGALVNAQAVATAINALAATAEHNVTVIACGERWHTPDEDGELRFAIEDYLGAGAILSHLDLEQSPEARLCAAAFTQSHPHISELLWDCASGRELRERGYGADVHHASQLDYYTAVPIMRHDHFEPL